MGSLPPNNNPAFVPFSSGGKKNTPERTSAADYAGGRCRCKLWCVVLAAARPLSRLFIHDQRDVALDQREGEEADVAGVVAGASRLLAPGKIKWILLRLAQNRSLPKPTPAARPSIFTQPPSPAAAERAAPPSLFLPEAPPIKSEAADSHPPE